MAKRGDLGRCRAEVNGPTTSKQIWDWWTTTARTRLELSGSITIVMTHWHEDDPVGRLLSSAGGEDTQFLDLDE